MIDARHRIYLVNDFFSGNYKIRIDEHVLAQSCFRNHFANDWVFSEPSWSLCHFFLFSFFFWACPSKTRVGLYASIFSAKREKGFTLQSLTRINFYIYL